MIMSARLAVACDRPAPSRSECAPWARIVAGEREEHRFAAQHGGVALGRAIVEASSRSADPISTRCGAGDAPKDRCEVARRLKSYQPCDFADRELSCCEQCGRSVDPPPEYESVWRRSRASLEESREMVGAHVHLATELREPELAVQIVLDVLRHASESARRQLADRPAGDGRHRGPVCHDSSQLMAAPSCFRSNNRARCTRDFTVGTLAPKTSAIWRCDRPSTSRKSSAAR